MELNQELHPKDEGQRSQLIADLIQRETSLASINTLLKIKEMRGLSPQEYEALGGFKKPSNQELLSPTSDFIKKENKKEEIAED